MRVWLSNKSAKDMNPEEAAWLGGFFDGEGSLVVSPRKDKKSTSRVFLGITNTCLPALSMCQEITGTRSIRKRKKYIESHKDKYDWRVHSQRNIAHILHQIRHYLICKAEKVDMYLQGWSDI